MYSIADGHCDTIVKMMNDKEKFLKNKEHIDLDRLRKYGSPVQMFAIWLDPVWYPTALRQTIKYIDFYFNEIEKNKDYIAHSNSSEDIIRNKNKGKISGLLSLEGGEALEGEISSLRMFYKLGVRAMTLTWNHRNQIGDGVGEFQTKSGLTHFGNQVVKEMNKLGMIVDVSHLNEEGFWDVEKIVTKPYIASHSNAKSVCDTPRNLTDKQIKAIANRNGVIGINLYPRFISKSENTTIEDVMKHIDHMIKLVGDDYIGLGCDFDGIETTPLGLNEISDIEKLLKAVERKYGENTASKIAEENLLRVINDVL